MQNASQLNWSAIARFSPNEWPAGVLESMDARVIKTLTAIRDKLPADYVMIPSPVPEAQTPARPEGIPILMAGE